MKPLPKWLCAMAVMALLTAAVLTRGHHPLAGLPFDSVVLYVGECPASLALLNDLEQSQVGISPPLIVPVPVDPGVQARVCAVALPRLAKIGWLTTAVPDETACQRLYRDAAAFHREHFDGLPAFSIGGVPVPFHAHAAFLWEAGIVERIGSDGKRKLALRNAHGG